MFILILSILLFIYMILNIVQDYCIIWLWPRLLHSHVILASLIVLDNIFNEIATHILKLFYLKSCNYLCVFFIWCMKWWFWRVPFRGWLDAFFRVAICLMAVFVLCYHSITPWTFKGYISASVIYIICRFVSMDWHIGRLS